jgi:hypothetical protein
LTEVNQRFKCLVENGSLDGIPSSANRSVIDSGVTGPDFKWIAATGVGN